MQSLIAEKLKLKNSPVAIVFTDTKPENALQFRGDAWGCVVAMFSAASRGKTAVFDRASTGCPGGVTGLCFGSAFEKIPGGAEYFLSTGRGEGFPEGEAYIKTPELARDFIEHCPVIDIEYEFVVFKPLSAVNPETEKPALVSFLVNPDQLTGLFVLANYGRRGNENVAVPFGAGCHTIVLLPYRESLKEHPRAIIGLMDVSARPFVDPELLSFTVPWSMFLEMEENVPGSFFEKDPWKKVANRIV